MFKRSIAILLTALFVLCLPAIAFAADNIAETQAAPPETLYEASAQEAVLPQPETAQPQAALASHTGEPVGTVKVTLQNNTYKEGAPWAGTKLDAVSVPIYADSTMLNAATDALSANGIPFVFNPDWGGYISEIDGLAQGMGAATGGWMLSQNDWFTEVGAGDITVANGRLKDGDSISILYSLDYGMDIGSDFNNNDKRVKSVAVSAGKLRPAFNADTSYYTLHLSTGEKSVSIVPTAKNKNFQVRIFANDSEYAHGKAIPVKEGSMILVECGDPAWPTMNAGSEEIPGEVYTFNVTYKPQPIPRPANLKAAATKGGAKVTWSKAAGAEAYQVYRSEKKVGGYKLIKATKSSAFIDSGLRSGKLYYYKVIPYRVADGIKIKGATAGPAAVRPK